MNSRKNKFYFLLLVSFISFFKINCDDEEEIVCLSAIQTKREILINKLIEIFNKIEKFHLNSSKLENFEENKIKVFNFKNKIREILSDVVYLDFNNNFNNIECIKNIKINKFRKNNPSFFENSEEGEKKFIEQCKKDLNNILNKINDLISELESEKNIEGLEQDIEDLKDSIS